MEGEIKTWLEDVRRAIDEIESFLPEKRNFVAFQNDLKGKRAVERNLEIIGEAVQRILKLQPGFPITKARKIVDTRNRISHGYDSVSDDIVWAIVMRDMVLLKAEVKDLLGDS